MPRSDYRDALRRADVGARLADYDPHVAGTPPLGLDLPGSDIDILCHAPDAAAFAEKLWSAWHGAPDFRLRQRMGGDRPVVASFTVLGWAIEIFGQALPVAQQMGWRHFLIERRLLAIGGPPFRDAVMRLRQQRFKTEPAFAALLGLEGDPYIALLALEGWAPAELAALIARRLAAGGGATADGR